MTMLHIGFDAKRIVRNATGLGHYGRTLVTALSAALGSKARLHLYVPDRGRDDLRALVPASPYIIYTLPAHCRTRIGRDLWRTRGIVADLKRDGITLYHGLTGELPVGIRRSGIRSVVTIHDLIFMRHPEYYNPIDVLIYKWKFRCACREADRIVAISECTRRDVAELGHFPADRIDVVYQSIDRRFRRTVTDGERADVARRYHLPSRYILFVGTIEERKNGGLVIEALPQIDPQVHFVMVGRQTAYTRRILRRASALGVADRVHAVSGVPDADMGAIYRMAEVFAYPSRYEGFGLPIVEAIQCGLPVVAATGSCLEEAGGDACFYVAPDDVQAMADTLSRLLADPTLRQDCVKRSRAYISRFENGDIARQMTEVYRRTLEAD